MGDTIKKLHSQLADAEEKLRLIQERKSQFVQQTSIPLELIRDERGLESQIADIRSRLSNLLEVPCPYRGLEAFRSEDTAFYFGRQAMIERLAAKVANNPLVVLVGPSGCGKSSLLKAGLAPGLGNEMFPGSRQWSVEIIRPGDDAIMALAGAFEGLLEPTSSAVDHLAETRKLAKHLREKTIILQDVIAKVRSKRVDIHHLLLVVDQFEAIYARDGNLNDQALFFDQLDTVIGNDWLTVLLSLRADFYEHILSPPLGKWIDEAQLTVQPMDAGERRAIIEQPAHQTGRSFEAGLVDRILADISDAARDLPLLEFTLTQLWEQQTAEGQLTHAAYENLGRVSGAVARHAESVYSHLKPDQQTIARHVLTSLVRVGRGEESGKDVRCQRAMHSFDAETQGITSTLASARLVTTSWNILAAEPVVELVHETLLIHWKRFQDWINADREFLLWRQRLGEHAQDWKANDQDEALLLRGQLLLEAQEWLAQRNAGLDDNERIFIEASQDWQQREREDEQRELQAREWRRRRIVLVSMMAAIGFMILAGFAVFQWRRVEQQRQVTLSRQLVAQAELERSNPTGSLTKAALLAVESLQRASNVEASMTANRILERLAAPVSRVTHNGAITDVEFSPDGTRVASASADGIVRVWEAATGRALTQMTHRHGVTTLAFSPDGLRIVSWDSSGEGSVWEADTGSKIARMKHEGFVGASTAFSPNGKLILSGSDDTTARVWDADTGREIVRVSHQYRVRAVAFSPDGQAVASGDNGFIRIWQALSGEEIARGDTGIPDISAIAYSGDGKLIAAAGGVLQARLNEPMHATVVFEAATGREMARLKHQQPLYNVAFSPDDQFVASAQGWSGSLITWQVATAKPMADTHRSVWIWDIAFRPDGQEVATAEDDGTARVWDTSTGAEVARVEHLKRVRTVAFSPDGLWLASGSEDGMVQVSSFPGAVVSRVEQPGLLAAPPNNDLSYSAAGSMAVSATSDSYTVWEPTTGHVVTQTIPGTAARMMGSSVGFSPDGRLFAAMSPLEVVIERTETWELVAKLVPWEEMRRLSENGQKWPQLPINNRLWLLSDGYKILIVDMNTEKAFMYIFAGGKTTASSLSPDGRWIAVVLEPLVHVGLNPPRVCPPVDSSSGIA